MAKSIKADSGDFTRQLFLMVNDIKSIEDETKLCVSLLAELRKDSSIQQVGNLGKISSEKYSSLSAGFVTDWTVGISQEVSMRSIFRPIT